MQPRTCIGAVSEVATPHSPPTLALVSKLFGMCVALSADPSALLCCEIWIAAANDALDLLRAAPSILQPGKCGA